ncbi:MAG: EamA family transporter, partial [Rubrivivax sp.]|nr:EamA family transporter [Rubrivivax sp.]
WAVLLGWALLGERPTRLALARVVLALVGAAIVLRPDAGGWPRPATQAEWLGLIGGFSFALNNVLLRREAARSNGARALAMFSGGMLVAGGLAGLLTLGGAVPAPPAPAAGWLLGAAALALWFLAGNLSLQYGAARLTAGATAVVMVTEVVFAAGSAVALGAGALTAPLLLGGAMIMAAALLATL